MKKKRVKLKGRLRIYMQTSLYLGLLLVLVDFGIYLLDARAGFLLSCFLLLYFGMIFYLMLYNRPIIINELVSFATQYGQIQKELLRELDVPYALLDEDGKIIWNNNAFSRVIHNERALRKSVTSFFSSVTRDRRRASRSSSFPMMTANTRRNSRGSLCGKRQATAISLRMRITKAACSPCICSMRRR